MIGNDNTVKLRSIKPAIHIFMGISTAGATLASGNIGLKLAPKGQATAYLAGKKVGVSNIAFSTVGFLLFPRLPYRSIFHSPISHGKGDWGG